MQTTPQTSTQSFGKVFAALGLLIMLCCLGVVCYSAGLFFVVDRDISLIPTPTLDLTCTDTTCLNACLRRLPNFEIIPLSQHLDELSKKQGGYELARYRLDEQSGQLKNVATPTVADYLKPYQADTQLHYRIWDYFTGIFPNDSDIHVSYMIVYMDGSENRYAASIWELDGKWRLYVNLLEFDSPQVVMDILTHEYGHMLTLNQTQTRDVTSEYGREMEQKDFDKMRSACSDRFFTGYACATDSSYMNAFGNRFWSKEVYEAWVSAFLLLDKEDGLNKTAINKFYAKYPDQFVSEYAATNPMEDMAESWTGFVMRQKPIGTSIADQKVLFFYEFPELVQTREAIIQGVCQYAVDQK